MPLPASGPVVTSLDELPGVEFDGVVIANELLDNLPFGIASLREPANGVAEVRVGLDGADDFVEVVVPALPADGARSSGSPRAQTPLSATGCRSPRSRRLVARVVVVVRHGYVVLLDTMDTTAGMLARGSGQWLRTYRGHASGGPPLVAPGSRDLVADVVVEQLHHAAANAGFTVVADTTQSAWLDTLGIGSMVDEGRRLWEERAAVGDLAALEARSRANQAAALTDPGGLGGHRVVVLGRGRV